MSQDEETPIPLDDKDDLAPLSLADEESGEVASARSSTKIRALGAHAAAAKMGQREFKRPLNLTGAGATRCRIFHSKITVAALEHMAGQINEWLDDGEIEVKYVSQVVGVMEGKTPEPNVIVTVWY